MQIDDQLVRAGAVAAAVLALVGLLTVAGKGVRWVIRTFRRLGEFLDDWNGEPARPGVAGRLGVMARLDRIEQAIPLDPPAAPPVNVTLHMEGTNPR